MPDRSRSGIRRSARADSSHNGWVSAEPTTDLGLDDIARLLGERLAAISPLVAKSIQAQVDFYASTDVVSLQEITDTVHDNFRLVIAGITRDHEFDTSPATVTGAERADVGVPLPALMHAYRIGFQMVWREFMTLAEEHPEISRQTLLEATERIWQGQDAYVVAMSNAHRDRTTEMILDDASERAALTQHLLEGRVSSDQSLWEVAEHLRLPHRGPYLAVAAQPPVIGKTPLPGIETRLRGIDLYSAWRLLPDQQMGIVHAPSPAARDRALDVLARTAVGRVGVSSPFTDLADTAKALRHARVALSGKGEGLSVFDNSVLGVAAVTAPEVTTDLAAGVLGRLYDLPDDDRAALFVTFRAWAAAGGNVTETAQRLFVHRNTVRHRLHRIEELTGRSTTAPIEVAELCLAFEVEEHFPIRGRRPGAGS